MIRNQYIMVRIKQIKKRLKKEYDIHIMILWNLIPDKDPEFAGCVLKDPCAGEA